MDPSVLNGIELVGEGPDVNGVRRCYKVFPGYTMAQGEGYDDCYYDWLERFLIGSWSADVGATQLFTKGSSWWCGVFGGDREGTFEFWLVPDIDYTELQIEEPQTCVYEFRYIAPLTTTLTSSTVTATTTSTTVTTATSTSSTLTSTTSTSQTTSSSTRTSSTSTVTTTPPPPYALALRSSLTVSEASISCPPSMTLTTCGCWSPSGSACGGSRIIGDECFAYDSTAADGVEAWVLCAVLPHSSSWTLVESSLSTAAEATCPGGTVLIGCSCYASDFACKNGAYGDGDTCKAVYDGAGAGNHAQAVCLAVVGSTDWQHITGVAAAVGTSTAECPANYHLTGCSCLSSGASLSCGGGAKAAGGICEASANGGSVSAVATCGHVPDTTTTTATSTTRTSSTSTRTTTTASTTTSWTSSTTTSRSATSTTASSTTSTITTTFTTFTNTRTTTTTPKLASFAGLKQRMQDVANETTTVGAAIGSVSASIMIVLTLVLIIRFWRKRRKMRQRAATQDLMFKSMDLDGDGIVTKDEFEQFCRSNNIVQGAGIGTASQAATSPGASATVGAKAPAKPAFCAACGPDLECTCGCDGNEQASDASGLSCPEALDACDSGAGDGPEELPSQLGGHGGHGGRGGAGSGPALPRALGQDGTGASASRLRPPRKDRSGDDMMAQMSASGPPAVMRKRLKPLRTSGALGGLASVDESADVVETAAAAAETATSSAPIAGKGDKKKKKKKKAVGTESIAVEGKKKREKEAEVGFDRLPEADFGVSVDVRSYGKKQKSKTKEIDFGASIDVRSSGKKLKEGFAASAAVGSVRRKEAKSAATKSMPVAQREESGDKHGKKKAAPMAITDTIASD